MFNIKEIINKEDLKNEIPSSDYSILVSHKNKTPVFVINKSINCVDNDIFIDNKNVNNLVNLEVSVRRCKRVGFFEYSGK